jgi:hypothetical protein
MGFSPQAVDEMEPWQLFEAFKGWAKANSPKQDKAPSDEEFERAVARTVH